MEGLSQEMGESGPMVMVLVMETKLNSCTNCHTLGQSKLVVEGTNSEDTLPLARSKRQERLEA